MENLLRLVVAGLPLIFALGFLAPVIAQSMDAAGWTAPFGLGSLSFGLIIGGMLGLIAQIRGRWV